MPRLLLSLLFLFVSIVPSLGQQFVQIGTGNLVLPGSNSHLVPIYRPSAMSDQRFTRGNSILSTLDLAGIPQGARIKGVAWHKANEGATVVGNPLRMEIWLRHSTRTQPPLPLNMPWNAVTDSFSRVFNTADLRIPDSIGWVYFPFDRDFVYEAAALEVATETEIDGVLPYTTDRFAWTYTFGFGSSVVGQYNAQALPPLLNQSNQNARNRANIRVYYDQPLSVDLQLEQLVAPVAPVLGASQQQLAVTFLNAGMSVVSSAQFFCRLNDGTIHTAPWTGSLAPGQRTTFTFPQSFQMPQFGTVDIVAWIGGVNGSGNDGYVRNDTIREQRCLSFLPGEYYVGHDTADFKTLEAALQSLHCGGVNGPVNLILLPGSYRGHFDIGSIPGANSANVITITSYLGNAPGVVFYEDDIPLYPEIFKFSGASHFRLEQLRFVRNTFQFGLNGSLIRVSDGANQLKIKDCLFIDSSDVTSSFNVAIQIDEAIQIDIDSNYFQAFTRAVHFAGVGVPQGNKVRRNRFISFGTSALQADDQVDFEVRGNRFQDGDPYAALGTCLLRRCTGLVMDNNQFEGLLQARVMSFQDMNSDTSRLNRVFNNSIAGRLLTTNANGAPQSLRPIFINGMVNSTANNPADQLELINNSVQVELMGTVPPALNSAILSVFSVSSNPSGFDSLALVNNIFAAYGAQDTVPLNFSALYLMPDTLPGLFFDYNDYFLQNGQDSLFVASGGIRINSLPAWQQRRNFDLNSQVVDPIFVESASTLPTNQVLNNLGIYIPWLTEDIKGVFRPVVNMDMGAHEFEQPQIELVVRNIAAPAPVCQPGDSIILSFEIINLGAQSLTDPRFALQINGQLVERKTFAGISLVPQQATVLTFDSAYNFNAYGSKDIVVWVDSTYDAYSANDTARASTFTQQVKVFPTLQTFDGLINGRLDDLSGWRAVDAAYSWQVQNGQSPILASGPVADRTKGNASGKYVFANAAAGALNDTALLYSPCLDLSSLAVPMLEFWYHGFGAHCDLFWVDQYVNGSWVRVDSLFSPTHTLKAAPWERKRIFLDLQATQVRFVAVNTGYDGAWALDDIRLGAYPMIDLVLSSMDVDYSFCDTSTLATAILELRSDGWFANATGVRAGLQLNGGTPIYRNTNRLLLPGAVDTLHFAFPLSGLMPHTLTAFAAELNDQDFALDTLRQLLQLQGKVTSFPYAEDFEGNHGWTSGGSLNSWQVGRPQGVVFDRAFSGQNAWVTNLSGVPNLQENSTVSSPCFDFSTLLLPTLEFQYRAHLQPTTGVNLEYSTDGGASWQVLGDAHEVPNWYNVAANAFSSAFTPVWSGSTNAQIWRRAAFDLGFLAGQPNVKFRFRYYGSLFNNSTLEGFTFDDFKITDTDGCFVLSVDTLSNACVPTARTVSARIARPAELQSIHLVYAVDGGAEQLVPMTAVGGNEYAAVIPSQGMGAVVRYSVRTQGSIPFQSRSLHYIDGFLQTLLTDRVGPTNTAVNFDARLAPDQDFSIGLSNLTNVGGYWMELTAKRHLELGELSIQARQRTGVDIYLIQGDGQAAGLNPAKVAHLGTYLNLANQGFSRVTLQEPILMRAGQQAILYIQATVPNALGAALTSGPFVLEDSSIAVRAGRVTTNNFQQTGQWTYPSMIFHVENPADVVQWQQDGGPLLTGPVLATPIPFDSSQVRLQIARGPCSWADTAMLRSTGQIDVGVTQILEPDFTALIPNEFYAVKVVLKNHGTLPVGSISMAYQVDGAEYGIASTGRAIPPGDTIHFRYAQFYSWSGVDTPVFCSYPKFVEIDADRANDTLCITAFATTTASYDLLAHRLYPNPSNGLLWIEWEGNDGGDLQLEVLNSLGSVVFRQQWHEAPTRVAASLTGLPAGLYQYRLRSRQQTAQGKLVLMH